MDSAKTIIVKEFEEVEVPDDFIGDRGDLRAFEDVLRKDYFSVRYTKGKIVFQAGGYVGLIPVNKNLTLDIRPKVPLQNLERMLFLSNHEPQVISRLDRKYGTHQYAPASIGLFLETAFLKYVEQAHGEGLLKFFETKSELGLFPRGRIDLKKTIQHRAKNRLPVVHTSWYERHPDNPVNRLLKNVLIALLASAKDSNKRRRRIAFCLSHFDKVSLDTERRFLSNIYVREPLFIPSTKESYRKAVVLAKTILSKTGIAFLDHDNVQLESLILNLDDSFERYARAVLEQIESRFSGVKVLDGNKAGIKGGRKALLDASVAASYINQKITATPDIVLTKTSMDGKSENLIIEVKYKAIKFLADRSDLNQIISYASSYEAKSAVLLFPSTSKELHGLRCLGTIEGKNIYQYFLDLNSLDMMQEETKFIDTIVELFNL